MYYYVLTFVDSNGEIHLKEIDTNTILVLLELIPSEYSEEGASTDTPDNAPYYNIDEFWVDDEFVAHENKAKLWEALKEYGRREDNSPWFKPCINMSMSKWQNPEITRVHLAL